MSLSLKRFQRQNRIKNYTILIAWLCRTFERKVERMSLVHVYYKEMGVTQFTRHTNRLDRTIRVNTFRVGKKMILLENFFSLIQFSNQNELFFYNLRFCLRWTNVQQRKTIVHISGILWKNRVQMKTTPTFYFFFFIQEMMV